ncbi:lactate utilization protein C [Shewanella psychropiezotolerans]|uniref:Lactate utilization protein C n=2 Tax=Shewanellaceae TaxID=267890 RepID=A0ABX5X5I6_9GAMM|nr:lactate utilization protein C [Shewanella sp. YLB-07]QDO86622.1 lactate utilization protein C [Shewanella psychropiezotolerans]
MVAKRAILARLNRVKLPPIEKETLSYPRWKTQNEQLLKQRFISGLSANHAEVICVNSSEITATLALVISRKGCQRVALGSACDETLSDSPPSDCTAYHCERGEFYAEILAGARHCELLRFESVFEELKSRLFNEVDAGITHCFGGIADTGTLVLWPDRAEPRTLSLIPPCHIALIKRSTIVSNFAGMMIDQAWQEKMPTNIVLVSGPSKTADIQQTLAYGAHGPSQLIVILIEDR